MSVNQDILGNLFSTLFRKITVPKDFHNQVDSIKTMLTDDVSGLIDVLTDFSVESASVDFSVETENETFTEIMKKWLNTVNIEYQGKIPSGIKSLSEEYFKERWKGSSFPILKLSGWKRIKGIELPSKMYFVDGGSVYAEDKDKGNNLKLINYDYYLGKSKKSKLENNVIFTRPYGRWFDKYPTPYLIKRGVYHNYKIIDSLKNKQTTVLDQIIPYMMLLRTGTEKLSQERIEHTDEQFKQMVTQIQTLITEIRGTSQTKAPIDAASFDKKIEHLIPDLSTIFSPTLFTTAERNILSGLGFIDVVEATSTSRRESILNPKAFIVEVNKGVKDFKQLLREIVILIIERNRSHIKYLNSNTTFHIISSPVTAFMTDDFKEKIRQIYDRGLLSKQTTTELIGEVDFNTEVHRVEKETKDGLDLTLYPPIRENKEGIGIDIHSKNPSDTDPENIPEDKKDKIEKENYKISKFEKPIKCLECQNIFDAKSERQLENKKVECPKCGVKLKIEKINKDLKIAPYKTTKELPKRVKDNLSTDLQKVFLKVFNNAYNTYKNDTMASRVAWALIKKIARKSKDGKWYRVKTKGKKVVITRAMIEQTLTKLEDSVIEDAIKSRKLENTEKRTKLLDKLLKTKKENETL